jgi:hypothetical protein
LLQVPIVADAEQITYGLETAYGCVASFMGVIR